MPTLSPDVYVPTYIINSRARTCVLDVSARASPEATTAPSVAAPADFINSRRVLLLSGIPQSVSIGCVRQVSTVRGSGRLSSSDDGPTVETIHPLPRGGLACDFRPWFV